jgi:hypothetical protein
MKAVAVTQCGLLFHRGAMAAGRDWVYISSAWFSQQGKPKKYAGKGLGMAMTLEELLAGKQYGDISSRLYQERGKLVRELIHQLEVTDDDETRRAILNILGRYGFDHPEDVYGSTGTIMKILDEKPALKSEGACALGNLVFNYQDKSAEILPMLREMLKDDDVFVREDAAYAIGNIGFNYPELVKEELPALIHMLDSEDEDEREAGAHALGKIGVNSPELIKDQFPQLVKVLEHAKETSCGGVVFAFGAVGFNYPELVREHIPRLIEYLKSRNPVVVKNAVMAIGIIGMTSPELIDDALPFLEELTHSKDQEIALNAQVAMKRSGG